MPATAAAWERYMAGTKAGAVFLLGDVFEVRVESGELAVEAVEVGQHLGERFVGERIIEPLATDPRAMHERPRFLAVAVDPAVTQQLLSDPMTGRGPRATDVIAAAQQISEPLGLRGRRLNEPQQTAAKQRDELLGVPAVGLHSVPTSAL